MTEAAEPGRGRGGIGRASALLASGTLVSRVLGFVKIIVLANTIGQVGSATANAFGLANQLPNNIYALIAGGVLGAVLVPQIVKASRSEDGGRAFIDKLVTLGIVGFAGLTALATAAAPLLVALYAQPAGESGRGFDGTTMALATAFAWWCLPQIFFYALYSLLGEVLNARGMFGPFTWAPVLNNIVAIAGLLVISALFTGVDAEDPDRWTPGLITVLGGSATLGVAAQALVLTVFWRRAGLRYRPDFRWRGVGLRRTGQAAGWAFGMVLVTQLAGIVQSRVATMANEAASIATLQNSWLIFMLPVSVITVSIATAYYTRMSGHVGEGDLGALRSDIASALRASGILIVFASVAAIVVAYPLARVFEEEFDDVGAMASVLIAYLVGLVPYSSLFVLLRSFYALDDTRTPFLVQSGQSALFAAAVFAAGLLVPVEWIGVTLALIASVTGALQALALGLLLRRRVGAFGARGLMRRHVRFFAVALLAGGAGLAVVAALGAFDPNGFAMSGIPAAVISAGIAGAVMAVVYLGVLALMRDPDVRGALGPLTGRMRRG